MLGKIVTFYSYKGGTGRSMALANFAWILAASGKRVLTIDWDLEAPGLHRYFRPFLIDPNLTETDGLIDVFWRSAASAMGQMDGTPSGSSQPSGPVPEDPFGEALENTAVRLDHTFPSKGFIDFIAAGRQTPTYSQRVNTFVWWRFYDIGGSKLLQEAREYLASQYDWVLIDSRTGVSDTAGISTIQMPDMVVACFTLNRQSIEGVSNILKSIRDFRSVSVDGSRKAFFPIATRIENAEQHRLEMARIYARSMLADFLPGGDSSRDYWDDMEVAYRPAYAFEEVLAA
jgi:cellulose biosynthesis protein BcsQ